MLLICNHYFLLMFPKKSLMIIKDRGLLRKIVEELKKQGSKVVFTNGCFDIIHKGHVNYLKEAKKLGDVLIVGVNTDESIKRIKGEKRPIIPLESRMEVLDSLKPVDFVIPFHEDTPEELIKVIKPDVHVKGGDYKEEDLPEAKIVRSYGGEVKIIPTIGGYSTTKIIEWVLKKYK